MWTGDQPMVGERRADGTRITSGVPEPVPADVTGEIPVVDLGSDSVD